MNANALPTREELIAQGYPFGKAADGIPLGNPQNEYLRTGADIQVYLPHHPDGCDQDNEHFLVFPAPSGKKLLAVWTQSSVEGRGDNHLVISESENGVDWQEPRVLSGCFPGREDVQASWGFPIVTRSGRMYLFCAQGKQMNPELLCMYSDDEGKTFSVPTIIPFPDYEGDGNWIVWQLPMRMSDGAYLAVCTIFFGAAVTPGNWTHTESRSYLLAFDNLDEDPEPADIHITWRTEKPVCVPDPLIEGMSVSQEPAIVELPDGRIWMQVRTMQDAPYWAISQDGGRNFSEPKPMMYADGTPVLHPLSPCPIYEYQKGKYFILVHQNPGIRLGFDHHELDWKCNYSNFIRNPAYICLAEYDEHGEQPLKIGAPVKLLDSGDVAVGPKQTAETGTYTSFTQWRGESILWYPDRKFYLLGKRLEPYGITEK